MFDIVFISGRCISILVVFPSFPDILLHPEARVLVLTRCPAKSLAPIKCKFTHKQHKKSSRQKTLKFKISTLNFKLSWFLDHVLVYCRRCPVQSRAKFKTPALHSIETALSVLYSVQPSWGKFKTPVSDTGSDTTGSC